MEEAAVACRSVGREEDLDLVVDSVEVAVRVVWAAAAGSAGCTCDSKGQGCDEVNFSCKRKRSWCRAKYLSDLIVHF